MAGWVRVPLAALVIAAVWPSGHGRAAGGLPAGFQDALFVSGLSSATTAMEFSPDGRLFVAYQTGQLRVVKNGTLLTTPFISLTVNSSGERGLLGIAFDPDFAANQFVYVYYTATTPAIHNRISRFKASGDVADQTQGETVLLDFDNLSGATNHNGGALHFGADGKLYAAHGDNATGSNAQSMNNVLGKIIRMNPVPDPTAQIPTDNPFFASASGKNRLIWVRGLRNPFTFSIQPGTGLTYVNDVGESTWEEINDARSGRNFGWPTTEGLFNASTFPQFTNPVYVYAHSSGTPTGCAITGGAFYNPANPTFPASYVGKYFFGDYCSGWIYYINPASPATATPFANGISAPVDLKVGPDGALYYLARGAASVSRITSTAGSAPQITQHPVDQTVPVGSTATFTVAATGTAPLNYQWQRNNTNITGATNASYTTPPVTATDNNAAFRCIVTNAAGTVTSNAGILRVTSNTAPTLTILTPAVGSKYSGGTTLSFSGTGNDAEDGALPASRFTWRIDFHHDTHTHPAMLDTVGIMNGTFNIPNSGETSANVWYRLHLTVKDSGDLSASGFVDIVPNTSVISLATSPSGLQVTLDGQPIATPASVTGVVGIMRAIGAVSPQTSGGVLFNFQSWSDGGGAIHSITTPAANQTFTATYGRPPQAPTGLAITATPGS